MNCRIRSSTPRSTIAEYHCGCTLTWKTGIPQFSVSMRPFCECGQRWRETLRDGRRAMISTGSVMKRAVCFIAMLAPLIALAFQIPSRHDRQEPPSTGDARLPNGKSQQEEILKAEHEKSLKDAAMLIDLAEQLRADL